MYRSTWTGVVYHSGAAGAAAAKADSYAEDARKFRDGVILGTFPEAAGNAGAGRCQAVADALRALADDLEAEPRTPSLAEVALYIRQHGVPTKAEVPTEAGAR